jgi:DNA-binding NarL/FixJ family response regulator
MRTGLLSRTTKNCFRCGKEFEAAVSERVCTSCRRPPRPGTEIVNVPLSFRENQVIALVMEAKLNKEIAYSLHLSEGTIKEYLNRIFRKVGVKNRTELAIWAMTRELSAA